MRGIFVITANATVEAVVAADRRDFDEGTGEDIFSINRFRFLASLAEEEFGRGGEEV